MSYGVERCYKPPSRLRISRAAGHQQTLGLPQAKVLSVPKTKFNPADLEKVRIDFICEIQAYVNSELITSAKSRFAISSRAVELHVPQYLIGLIFFDIGPTVLRHHDPFCRTDRTRQPERGAAASITY